MQSAGFDLADLLSDKPPKSSTDLGWLLDTPFAFSSLHNSPLWTAWREEDRGGNNTKVPYRSRSAKSAADDPATWIIREAAEVVAASLSGTGRKGVGIFLGGAGSLPMAGIDLDSCYDATTQAIEPWAQEVIHRFGSYGEISPSGTGVKVFFRYAAADLDGLRAVMATQWSKSWPRGSHVEIALHLGNRYFAVTDQHCAGTPREIRPVDRETLLWLIEDAGPKFKANAGPEAKDGSRSGRAMQLAAKIKRAGMTLDHYRAELAKEPDLADWAKDARQVQRAWERCAAGLAIDGSDFDDLPALDGFPMTEDGVARAFASARADSLRFCHSAGRWYVWTGNRPNKRRRCSAR